MSTLLDLQVGEALGDIVLSPVSRLDLIKYAGASGDYNPIHTIDDEAKKVGLPGIIAHGMWTMGNLAKVFTPFFEEGFLQDYSIRFKGMVFLNDIITLRAELAERNDRQLKFHVQALNQNGKEVLQGNAIFSIY